MSALAKIVERSKRERESWKYTDVEKILKAGAAATPHPTSPSRGEEPGRLSLKEQSSKNSSGVFPPLRGELKGGSVSPSPSFLFINGILQPEQSRFGDLPKNILQGDAAKGYALKLEGQTCLVTQPIELLFTGGAAGETATKLTVELGASGRLTLIERHENAASTHVMETEITLHPQAKLVHGKAVKGGEGAAHLALTKVKVAEGAYYDNFALITGGRLTRNEVEVTLAGKLAQATLNGAMLLRGAAHADTTTRIIHAAPDGSSRQVYKTVLADRAHGVFQGKIIVAQDAQKTDGYQLSRALLLSDQAEMNAKPELEIHADDVKCSHGSAVGDLDADALFYLRARGLSEDAARALLIRAFVDEIVDEIRVPEWRDFCRAEVEGWLDDNQ